MIFFDFTVDATGTLRSKRRHDSTRLVPEAVGVFADLFREHGKECFSQRIPLPALQRIRLQWRRIGDAALAIFFVRDEPLSVSALLPGTDAAADREMLREAQRFINAFLADSPVEPAFDLLSITDRPAIVSIPLPTAPDVKGDLAIVADMETCLAAAYFAGEETPEG